MSGSEKNVDFEETKYTNGSIVAVPSDLIEFANQVGEGFSNPRHAIFNGRIAAKGLRQEEMDEMVNAIQTEGLLHPLILRGTSNIGSKKLILLSGERRKRSIDRLKKENLLCFDPTTKTQVPARELYDRIECRIFIDIDDETAYKLAYSTNGRAVDIGEAANLAFIKQLRDRGWKEDAILRVTGKSITWLRDTFSVISLDEKSYDAVVNEDINRAVAIQLAKVADVKDRLARLATAKESAAKRILALQQKAEQGLEAAESAAERAQVEVADAVQSGNLINAKRRQRKLQMAQQRIENKQEGVIDAMNRSVTATSKDLEQANVTASDSTKILTHAKLLKKVMPVLEEIIKNGGKNEDGVVDCDPEDARLLLKFIEDNFNKNVDDPTKLLRHHFSRKTRKK